MRSFWQALLISAFCVSHGMADEVVYDYPIDDPFAATVLGTPQAQVAEFDPDFKLSEGRLRNLFDRKIPDAFWYAGELVYGFAIQDGPAPIAFIISGTGGDHLEARTRLLAALLFENGAHVVTLPSPTHPNFMVSASRLVQPGDPSEDISDLARVMKLIRQRIGKRQEITGTYLTGYSLGGMNAAFLAERDARTGEFGFDKVMVINPPMDLYRSALRLDGYLNEGVEGGFGNIDNFFDELMRDLAAIYVRADLVQLDGDFLFDIYKRKTIDDDRLKALIGLAFRLAAANLLFTSDAFNRTNYIIPRNLDLGFNTSLTPYFKVAVRISFEDYIDDLFVPGVQQRMPGLSREQIIEDASLNSIADFLSGASHVHLIHNANDPILDPGDIETFKTIFGERAQIFENGGHLGNLFHKRLAADIQTFFGE